MTGIAGLKKHISLRGIVMTVLTLAVAAAAIATLRYQPSVPDEVSIYSPPTTGITTAPWLAPGPPVTTPLSTTAPSPPPSPQAVPPPLLPAPRSSLPPVQGQTSIPTQTAVTTQAPRPVQTTSSTPTTSTSRAPFTPTKDVNPTELPNGGRRFGTVQQ